MTRSSIRTHLLLLILAVSVPLLAIVGYGIYSDVQQSVVQTKTSLRTLANIMVRNTNDKISHAHKVLDELVSRRTPGAPVDSAHCEPNLKDLHGMLPGYTNIGYTNNDGDIVCSALAMPAGRPLNISKAAWFQDLQKNKRFTVGPPFIGVISKKWVLVQTVPLLDAQQNMLGGINVSLNLNSYDPQIPTQFLPPGSRYGFFSTDGTLIWRNDDVEGMMGTRPDVATALQIVQIRDGEFEGAGLDGVPGVYSVVPMPEPGWIAFVGVPTTAVYAEAKRRATWSAAVALMAIAVLVLLAIVVARRITGPVAALERAARAVHGGDVTVRAPLNGPREVAAVAQEFNGMVEARLHSETRLASSEERYRTLIEHAPEAILVLDVEGRRIVDANPSAESLFGRSRAELLDSTMLQLYAPEQPDGRPLESSRHQNIQRALAGEAVMVDRAIRTPDGRERVCEVHLVRLPAIDQQLLRATFIDVTQRKRDEKVIIELNQRLRAVFDAAREVAIFATDAMGVMQVFNHGAELMLGYSAQEMQGQWPGVFIRDSELKAHAMDLAVDVGRSLSDQEAFLALARTGKSDIRNWTCVCKNGKPMRVSLALSAMRDQDGEVIGFVGIARDISEQLAAEASLIKLNLQLDNRVRERTGELQASTEQLQLALDDLRQTQKKLVQAEKLAALGSIVTAVAHELNTPLGICLTVASTLKDKTAAFEAQFAGGELRRKQLAEFLEVSRTAVPMLLSSLQRAIDLVLTFKEMAVGQGGSLRRGFELDTLLTTVMATQASRLRETPYTLDLDVPQGLHMDSFPGAIEQITVNLISNALLHAFEGRAHGSMRLVARAEGEHVRLSFSDDGCGMSENVRLHVFDPFFTTRLGKGGSGLGMSICYNLTTGPLGGSVEVSSALGQGTSFSFWLPRTAPG